jgi:hypothetical protein
MLLVWTAPFLGLCLDPWTRAFSAVTLVAAIAATFYLIRVRLERSSLSALLSPILRVFPVFLLADSTFYYWRNQGAYWRETFYSVESLKQSYLSSREKVKSWRNT